ncbi:MAG TPA: protein kinase [Gemmataceae bacterium]|nr:protein kinase [Gemmataceae bacterium]
MPHAFTCPQGHQWQPNENGPAPATGAMAVCPICGLAGQASAALAETVTFRPAPPGVSAGDAAQTLPPTGPPAMPAAHGKTVTGYEIYGELGRGGMGIVYKARQLKAERLVALKMILAGAHAGAQDLARFRTEAQAVARLQHPNIVQVYEVGEQDGLPFFSLEFVEGGSLAARLDGTPWPARKAAALVETLARAVHAAHAKGIVHRDLKPGNVLLTADGQPKVTDFGLAKRLDRAGQTQTGAIMGTPSYMAPEQAGGFSRDPQGSAGGIGPAADVYALGAILYELLTGRPPFRAETRLDTVLQVVSQEPVPPRQLQPKTPADLETVCLKCLQKDPARRYTAAAALAEDLGRFLAGRPVLARPVGRGERLWRWCRRNPALATTAGLALLATAGALVILAVAVVLVSQSRNEAIGLAADNNARAETEAGLRQQAQWDAANRAFEQAYTMCQYEDAGVGLLWLAQSLEAAQKAKAADVERSIRYHLGGWSRDLHPPLAAVLQHQGPVWAVAFSPDGKTVLTGSADYTARLWEARTAKPLGPPLQHRNRVTAVAFSPDGKTVLTGSSDATAQLWEAATGKTLGLPIQHQLVTAVAFSPDGKTVLTGSENGTARLWLAATGKPLAPPLQHQGKVWAVAFSPDSKAVLTGSGDSTARLWEAATGKALGPPLRHQGFVQAVAFSPDGKTVLTGSADNRARLWQARTGKLLGPPLRHQGEVRAVAFSPDGKTVLTGSGTTARLWEVRTGKPPGPPLQHQGPVSAVAFSPDGKTVLTGGWDYTARLWEARTGKSLAPPLRHRAAVTGAAFSPDGKVVLTGSRDFTARLWQGRTGHAVGPPLRHQGPVSAVAFSPDGKVVLTGSWDKTARLWEARTGKRLASLVQHRAAVTAVAFSPVGTVVLTGSQDNTARLWEVATGKALGPPLRHQGWVWAVAFSPDGKIVLTGSWDNTARLWEARTGKPLGGPLQHQSEVSAVAFSPDGRAVLTGSRDFTARLWETRTGKALGPPLRHQGMVSAVAFRRDGKAVLTGSQDRTAQVWEAPAPVKGGVERTKLWTQVVTGMELDEHGTVRVLSIDEWKQRRDRLQALGGPPQP